MDAWTEWANSQLVYWREVAEGSDGDAALLTRMNEKAGDGTTDYLVEIRQSDLARLIRLTVPVEYTRPLT